MTYAYMFVYESSGYESNIGSSAAVAAVHTAVCRAGCRAGCRAITAQDGALRLPCIAMDGYMYNV